MKVSYETEIVAKLNYFNFNQLSVFAKRYQIYSCLVENPIVSMVHSLGGRIKYCQEYKTLDTLIAFQYC